MSHSQANFTSFHLSRVVSKRYLNTLDLSEYQMEPRSNLFPHADEAGKSEVSGADEDTNFAGAQGSPSSFENDRKGSEG